MWDHNDRKWFPNDYHDQMPPWRRWDRRRGGRFLFFRFALMFGLMTLSFIGGLGAIAFILTRIMGGDRHIGALVWVLGCSLSVTMPMIGFGLARGAFRRIANPLANLMSAADSVSEGDFSVRVPEGQRGEFRRLTRSFNHMVSELERAEQQRRNLTADVAHELNTPLHIIQGHLEGILDGVYEPNEEVLNSLLDETHLLSRLVEDLRTLSLAEVGELPLQIETLDLAELIADVQTSFSGQAEAAGIALSAEAEVGLNVSGDADRLGQVLNNLVVNALRHTPTGGTITIQARAVGEAAEITIEDDGVGISPEDLPFIFDRFWRGDKSRSHKNGSGHGLGLAIARQLVRAHGGEIGVESEVDKGTRFVVRLPRGGA